jgi:hypothetical protein
MMAARLRRGAEHGVIRLGHSLRRMAVSQVVQHHSAASLAGEGSLRHEQHDDRQGGPGAALVKESHHPTKVKE